MARRSTKKPIKYAAGSEELEALLSVGYGINKEQAEQIIEERDKDPHTHPYDEYQKAKAFLAALEAEPVAVSKRAPWKRTKG
jgi:hypothetical protein